MGAVFISLNIGSCSIDKNDYKLDENNIAQDSRTEEKTYQIPSTVEIVETLCSDEFGGRLVGSEGNKKTENYISDILKNINLDVMFDEEYFEPYTQEVCNKYGLIDENDKSEEKQVDNVIGVIPGRDNSKAIVISAHFDHIGYQDGEIIRFLY